MKLFKKRLTFGTCLLLSLFSLTPSAHADTKKVRSLSEDKINQDSKLFQQVSKKKINIISSTDINNKREDSKKYIESLNLTDSQKASGKEELDNNKTLSSFEVIKVKYKGFSDTKTKEDEEQKALEAQRQQQALEEQKKQQALEEQKKQQALEEQKKQEEEKAKLEQANQTLPAPNDENYSNYSPTVKLSNGNTAGHIGAYVAKRLEKLTGVSYITWETIISRESNGDPNAMNPSGAKGLLQTMSFWGPTNSIEEQISAAVKCYNAQGLAAWGM